MGIPSEFPESVSNQKDSMGSCVSSEAFHRTAKLIHPDGSLEEFAEPVKVAQILRERAGCFICHSDSMAFDEYLIPLAKGDELDVDHLHFLLPLTKLQRRVTASDMAVLAVQTRDVSRRYKHNVSRGKIVPVEDKADRQKTYQLSSVARAGEYDKKPHVLKSGLISVERSRKVGSRGAMTARVSWRTKLPAIPETFAY